MFPSEVGDETLPTSYLWKVPCDWDRVGGAGGRSFLAGVLLLRLGQLVDNKQWRHSDITHTALVIAYTCCTFFLQSMLVLYTGYHDL